MGYIFEETSFFSREFRRLSKKYKSLTEDLDTLKLDIQQEKTINAIDLGGGLKKVRIKISSKNKGKSAGARIIYKEAVIKEIDNIIVLVAIWDKSEIANIKIQILKDIAQGK